MTAGQRHYWPEGEEPPRLPDGSVDVRALCARWDDQVNQHIAPVVLDPEDRTS